MRNSISSRSTANNSRESVAPHGDESMEFLDVIPNAGRSSIREPHYGDASLGSLFNSVTELFQSSQMFTLKEGTTIDNQVCNLAARYSFTQSLDDTRTAIKERDEKKVAHLVNETFPLATGSDKFDKFDGPSLIKFGKNDYDCSSTTLFASFSTIGSEANTLVDSGIIEEYLPDPSSCPSNYDTSPGRMPVKKSSSSRPSTPMKHKQRGSLSKTLTESPSPRRGAPPRMPRRIPSASRLVCD